MYVHEINYMRVYTSKYTPQTTYRTSVPPGLETTVAIPQRYGRTENNSTRTGVFHVTPCGG